MPKALKIQALERVGIIHSCLEAMDAKIRIIEEEIKDIELPPPSERHKKRMNRLFLECVACSFIPFPEEDNP